MLKPTSKHSDDANKTLAQKLGLGPDVRELKLGQSFTNKKSPSFHTLRYDFKPASVDKSKMATLTVGENRQVTVTVPHMDGAGTPETIFKGCHRPYEKECVLIFDRNTGEVTLEKLTHNIQVKKTRTEQKHNKPPLPKFTANVKPKTAKEVSINAHGSKQTTHGKSHSGAQAQEMASSLSSVIPQHSPLPASPSYPQKKSPVAGNVAGPEIAVDMPSTSLTSAEMPFNHLDNERTSNKYLSESSSESSADSEGALQEKPAKSLPSSYSDNGSLNAPNSRYLLVEKLLSEDLQLSDSGSDD